MHTLRCSNEMTYLDSFEGLDLNLWRDAHPGITFCRLLLVHRGTCEASKRNSTCIQDTSSGLLLQLSFFFLMTHPQSLPVQNGAKFIHCDPGLNFAAVIGTLTHMHACMPRTQKPRPHPNPYRCNCENGKKFRHLHARLARTLSITMCIFDLLLVP